MTSSSRQAPAHIRTRLVMWMLFAVSVATLLLATPLAVIARQWVYGQELIQLQNQARSVGVVLDDSFTTQDLGTSVAVVALALDTRVTVLRQDGGVIHDSEGIARGTIFNDPVVAVAQASGSGQGDAQFGDGVMVAAVAGEITGTRVIIRLEKDDDLVTARAGTVLLEISGLVVVALVAGAAIASWCASQLAEPLVALATSARRLGQGDFSERAPRSGVVEIDHIAGALDATADRLRTALQRSASFTADASHQLRTPLTALRLDLDALEAELDSSHPMLDAAHAEIDRLEATITELLELTDATGEPDRVDLRALTLQRLDAWRTLADAAGRAVRVTRDPVPFVRARPGAVGQALQVLLDNALRHGQGDVTVWLESVSRGSRSWVRLCVGDEGPGVRPEHLKDGGGRGLSLAQSLIEAEGGRVVLDAEHGNRVCLLLPCDSEPALPAETTDAADAAAPPTETADAAAPDEDVNEPTDATP